MSLKTIIFDLDGTLLDTLDDLTTAGNSVLTRFGFPTHNREHYKYFVGDGLRVLMERATPDGTSPDQINECCRMFSEIYLTCWHDKSRPYDGIPSMLKQLQMFDVRYSVLSNKPHAFTRMYIDRFFPAERFEVVLGQREGVPKKPHPAGVIEIIEQMQVSRKECIYVGDTAVDIQTGKAAGIFTIGVLWGFREYEELKRHNADLIVKTPMELVDYVYSAR